MTRPNIGVTVSQRSGWRIFPLMAFNIWLAGGKALRWQTASAIDLDAVDGVVIGGGDDISPMLYGGKISARARLDTDRDEMEKRIVLEAAAANIPVLGICRGSQMLNVALGGTLHQDAYSAFPSRFYKTILPRKAVEIDEGTRLGQILQTSTLSVNALHTQAVEKLGENIGVAARDDGGMVQAIERMADPFAIGVQWHPEHLFYRTGHRRLFKALVLAAQAYRVNRPQGRTVDLGLQDEAARIGRDNSDPAGKA
ncbi:gamma-glutamyl-gamma-aminobutyrate hydrolase family protein [Ruegeria profundi]|uniref:Glutamine amidotransferase n=1 Tax=Ruegeria profundi TaxID=1685378 RepID=A0A0X3TNE9_9RHOB|nr:type 1 glutamine amidotransferase [Ruegeria profundi]KUJ77292.1 glutamine amidotransferase [Ruegeria profundi]